MLTADRYPMVLRREGCQARPRCVEPLGDGRWRVDLMEGSVTLYQQDPRAVGVPRWPHGRV
jgi:hypothetical protein